MGHAKARCTGAEMTMGQAGERGRLCLFFLDHGMHKIMLPILSFHETARATPFGATTCHCCGQDLPLASASSDLIAQSRVLLSFSPDAAVSY